MAWLLLVASVCGHLSWMMYEQRSRSYLYMMEEEEVTLSDTVVKNYPNTLLTITLLLHTNNIGAVKV